MVSCIRACNVSTDNVHGFGRISFRYHVDGVMAFAPIPDPDQPSEQHNTPPRDFREKTSSGLLLVRLSVVRDFETGGDPNLREILAHPV